jgi:hypothetical protein
LATNLYWYFHLGSAQDCYVTNQRVAELLHRASPGIVQQELLVVVEVVRFSFLFEQQGSMPSQNSRVNKLFSYRFD